MDEGMNKSTFLETLQSERGQWEGLLAQLDEAQMVEPGVAGDWSVKDIIAHVTAYERGLVEWLEAASRGELLELPNLDHPDVDHRNAVIFAANRTRPLQDVLLESSHVFQQLAGLVQALAEEELIDPQRTEWFVRPRWGESRALWKCIADDAYNHYRQHMPDIRAWLQRVRNSC